MSGASGSFVDHGGGTTEQSAEKLEELDSSRAKARSQEQK